MTRNTDTDDFQIEEDTTITFDPYERTEDGRAIYFIITSAGVPVDVTHIRSQALIRRDEWSSAQRVAEIVAVAPLQLELGI